MLKLISDLLYKYLIS